MAINRSVRFFGPMNKTSGYGNAVINFAKAFSISKINTKFVFDKKSYRHCSEIIKSLNNYKGECDFDFYLHGPPWTKHKSNKYKIAYFYWETNTLPRLWMKSLKTVNEIWAPCRLVVNACYNVGFKGRTRVVPTPWGLLEESKDIVVPSEMSDKYILSDNIFKFYSIFQWHERKNPFGLLEAYYSSFTAKDPVILILKINPLNINGNNKNKMIRELKAFKAKFSGKRLPKIFLITKTLSYKEMSGLHAYCDCYVSPHRGEGWGIPVHNAMLHKNHLIVTKFGGITEYLNESNANIIKHKLGPVKNMSWSPLYNNTQNWAYPSVNHLSEIMKRVSKNPDKFKYKISNTSSIINDTSIEVISKNIPKYINKR